MWEEERTSDVRPPLAHRLQKQLPDYMNEYERPAISVRQRIAAINRTVQEEERKAQNAAGRGAVRIPWRSTRAPARPASTSSQMVQLPQRPVRASNNRSPSLTPSAHLQNRKRESTSFTRYSLSNKSMKLDDGSSLRRPLHSAADTVQDTRIVPSITSRERRTSSRMSDIHQELRHSRLSQISTSSTSSQPPSQLNNDEIYQLYLRYLQCQLVSVKIHEAFENNKRAKRDQLWNMYAELSEFKNSADEKSVEEMDQLLNEYSAVSKQIQDAAEDLDTKISSDLMAGLVRDLYEILTAIRDRLTSKGSMKDVSSIDAEIHMLKQCSRLTDAVARAEAEHQSLSAIV